MEQQLPEVQERPVEEQTIPLQPKSTVRAGSPREAAEEPTGQQWMRPEGSIAHGEPRRSSPGQSCSLWRGAFAGAGGERELPPVGTCVGQCLKGGPHDMEPC